MTGLEKILSTIEQDSNDRCREITEQAQKHAQEIIDAASAKAQEDIENAKASVDKKVAEHDGAIDASVSMTKNRIILEGKLDIISSTLERALEVIKALPKKEYFEILKGLILKNVRKGEGVLCLSKEDTEKLPSNFIDSINNALKRGYKISLGESADIDSGFILVYGDIDINCSFDAVASAKREELRDTLNEMLFN